MFWIPHRTALTSNLAMAICMEYEVKTAAPSVDKTLKLNLAVSQIVPTTSSMAHYLTLK